MNIGIVTLGCTKNQVDSEMILGVFKAQGFNITNQVEEADIIVVNTCGFIEPAKEEAINTILEMADYKIDGNCKALIVTGCLAKRYKKEIYESLPEVDLVIGEQGLKEFCIIAQDTSKYGLDIYGELKLAELLRRMSQIEGVKWIRILYMYLYETTDELIEEIANNPKVCKYFDIPIQHLNNKMLKDMNRHDTKELIYDRIARIKELCPDAILRTTCIVGFPGETEEEFEELLDGVKELEFDRLGAFTYSPEENTPSYDFDGQLEEDVKQERLKRLMNTQKEISLKKNKARLGKTYEVIVEDIDETEEYFVCRSMLEAPDVDGRIYIKIDEDSAAKVIVGDYATVEIIDYNDYDLFAKVI